MLIMIIFPASVPAVWIGTIMLGVFMASLIPSTFTYAGQNIDMTGKVTGWFVMGIGAGNLIFPWLIGQMFEPVGPISLPLVTLSAIILAFVMIIAAYVLMGRRNKTQLS